MKIIFVVPKFEMVPVGIGYILAVIKKAGYDVDCLYKKNLHDIDSALKNKKYDLLCTGGMSSDYNKINDIVQVAKKNKIKVILGGAIVTCEPELISRSLNIDYSVIGEGEETIIDLLNALKNNIDLASVAGIGYFAENIFTITGNRKSSVNLDTLPYPEWDMLSFEESLAQQTPSTHMHYPFDYPRLYPIIGSRSCPYHCTFCYHPLGSKYRQRGIPSIIDELKVMIPKYKINIVSLYDELFSQSKDRVLLFCNEIIELQKITPWKLLWSCQMRVDHIDKELLAMMRAAGCYMISYGFESYSDIVLKSMKKRIAPEQIHQAIHITRNQGIGIQANFIFGDISENMDTAELTLDFWKKHSFASINLLFIMPIPNSEIYKYCVLNGIISDKLDFIKNNKIFSLYNMTKLNDKKFMSLQNKIKRTHLQYKIMVVAKKIDNNHLEIECPDCSNISIYRNVFISSPIGIKKLFFCFPIYCRHCNSKFYAVSPLYRLIARRFAFLVESTNIVQLYSFFKKIKIMALSVK